MATAVYGGTFNPLHIGHLAILRNLVKEFDRVLLVVSPKNPLKDVDSDPMARLQAARQAVERHPELEGKVIVSDIEFRLPRPSYTINTLDALKEEGMEPVLVIGGDQIADMRRWKDYQRILTEYGIAAFPREGVDSPAVKEDLLTEDPSYKIRLMDFPLVNVSSTQIREGLARGEDVSYLLM